MKISSFKINKILKIVFHSSEDKVHEFFRIKFYDLFSGEQDLKNLLTINLKENESLQINNPKILREITIPQICVFDNDLLYIIKDKKKIYIPFHEIGYSQEITLLFEKGFPIDWIRRLLEDLLDFHFLGFGGVFVHGACIIKNDTEIIIPAWRGTGKTNLALHLLTHENCSYKAEDQFFLFSDKKSFLFTDATHVDYKTIQRYESLRKYRSLSSKVRDTFVSLIVPLIPPRGTVLEFVRRGFIKLFAPKAFVKMRDFLAINLSHEQKEKKIICSIISRSGLDDFKLNNVDTGKMINRIIAGMQYERLDLYPLYYAWSFATGIRNENFDHYYDKSYNILKNALDESLCFEISIPSDKKKNINYNEILSAINNNAQK